MFVRVCRKRKQGFHFRGDFDAGAHPVTVFPAPCLGGSRELQGVQHQPLEKRGDHASVRVNPEGEPGQLANGA